MALDSGVRLGPYEILAQIGVGGMGEVYKALDTNLKRATAIKVLPESVSTDSERLARFQREAELLAALNHPNIAAIYGLERSGASVAIAMELVEGPTLADRVADGAVPTDEALPIARQLAEALEAAHEQGIVHRDLKPANIKLRPDGTVKVLDFGLAKALDPAITISPSASISPTITSPAMTRLGMILGTAAYMSPEQARGKPVDRRADIWAFGCVLFELLTARRAFEGEDVSLTLAEVMKSEPDWTLLPALPAAVRMCLHQCLKKDPRQRLRDIGEMRLALEGALDADMRISAPATAAPWRSAWRWVLPAAALSAIVTGALMQWFRSEPERPLPGVVQFEIRAPGGGRIPPGTPAISPDGRTLAFSVTEPDGAMRIHVRNIGATQSRALPGTENAVHPFFSPDGRSLAFVADRTLKRIDIDGGGPPRELMSEVTGPWHGSWGRFGDLLITATGVRRLPEDGGKAELAVVLDKKAKEIASGFPAFLSDGKRFLVRVDDQDSSAIHLASLDSTSRTLVVDGVLSAPLLAPTPGGRTYLLYLRDDALVAHEFDEVAGVVRGTPRVLVDRIGRVGNPPLLPAIGVTAAGTIAYQMGGDLTTTALTWMNRSGVKTGELSLDVTGQNPSLSPNGHLLALDVMLEGDRDIWVADVARGVTSRLTRGGGVDRSPVWSPDSARVAFARAGKIYVTHADGSTAETVLAEVEGTPTSWSPDGNYLLVENQGKLSMWPLNGGPTIVVGSRTGRTTYGRFSPDGRRIAFLSDESGRNEVYVQLTPTATGRVKVSVGGGARPRWGRSSSELFFVDRNNSLHVVQLQPGPPLSADPPKTAFKIADSVYANMGYEVSPDGERLLIMRIFGDNVADTPITVVMNWWAEFAAPTLRLRSGSP
jgi:Tol biopolymer transport system component